MSSQPALVARTVLALNRPLASGQPPARAADMRHEPALGAWYDPGHRFDAGDTAAFRAIDEAGEFCWLIRSRRDRLLLSHASSPYDAIAAANEWPAADTVLPWEEIEDLAGALRRRDVRFRLISTDFEGLPGAYVWLGRMRLPGWAAAWLMPVRPEIGAAIWAAHRRTSGGRQIPANCPAL